MIYTIAVYEVIYGNGQAEIITHAGINPDYPASDFAIAHKIIVEEKNPGARVNIVGVFSRSYPGGPWTTVNL